MLASAQALLCAPTPRVGHCHLVRATDDLTERPPAAGEQRPATRPGKIRRLRGAVSSYQGRPRLALALSRAPGLGLRAPAPRTSRSASPAGQESQADSEGHCQLHPGLAETRREPLFRPWASARKEHLSASGRWTSLQRVVPAPRLRATATTIRRVDFLGTVGRDSFLRPVSVRLAGQLRHLTTLLIMSACCWPGRRMAPVLVST